MDLVPNPVTGRLWVIRLSEELGRRIHEITKDWPTSQKEHEGDQLIRATDSIGSNLSEGHARVHIKDRLHFIYMAQGSLEEALFYLRRARERKLVSELESAMLSALLIKLAKAINNYAAYQRRGEYGGEPIRRCT